MVRPLYLVIVKGLLFPGLAITQETIQPFYLPEAVIQNGNELQILPVGVAM